MFFQSSRYTHYISVFVFVCWSRCTFNFQIYSTTVDTSELIQSLFSANGNDGNVLKGSILEYSQLLLQRQPVSPTGGRLNALVVNFRHFVRKASSTRGCMRLHCLYNEKKYRTFNAISFLPRPHNQYVFHGNAHKVLRYLLELSEQTYTSYKGNLQKK